MIKRLTVIAFVTIVFLMWTSGGVWSSPQKKQFIYPEIAGPVDSPTSQGEAIPLPPGIILVSPGQKVGTTYYDYQTNGSTGNRIVKDSFGNIHVCWMNGINQWTGNRWVYYNFRDAASGTWGWPTIGTQVNPPPQGDGYTNMDVLSTDEGVVAYHSLVDRDFVVISVDELPGFGSFTEYNVPDNVPGSDSNSIWPYVAVDRQDRVHIVSHEYITTGGGTPKIFTYTRSDDGGSNWTDPVVVDTLHTLCGIIVASSVNDKVAVVYGHHTADTSVYHDIYYVESPDGVTWDWNNKVNVTNYYTNPSVDSVVAFSDNDAIYDNDGNLHIVWVGTHYATGGGWYYKASVMHWSAATGITKIAQHIQTDFVNCEPGGWNLGFAKLSIGVDADDNLFTIFTHFDSTDCSIGGFANGELYGTASNNGGASWARMVNLTNSPTPYCWPLDCDSDHWSSMAETVDDSLYILYINDKDAGGIPQEEGVATENPVMYLAVDKSVLLRVIGVDEDKEVEPTAFTLKQNYPNPFNASTAIEYVTKTPGQVELAVYNLVGEKVEVLVDKVVPAGEHTVTWDAGDVASGVYYYRLSTAEGAVAKRMLLLR